ncbi:unnamed protein product [Phytophthora fragariaefolia]|uniref:Unnamed protein product n=1 Tax=Phytophthora fragariaefolia TaxID=1490495 RepID=A0A9W6YNU8_9STRA|nr:unnamed protein product [Phytophthora fragariaefolia]
MLGSNTNHKFTSDHLKIRSLADRTLELTMGLQDLAPANLQRALQTVINAFGRFVAAEGVSMHFIAAFSSGRCERGNVCEADGSLRRSLGLHGGTRGKATGQELRHELLPACEELVARHISGSASYHREEVAQDGADARAPLHEASGWGHGQEGTRMHEGGSTQSYTTGSRGGSRQRGWTYKRRKADQCIIGELIAINRALPERVSRLERQNDAGQGDAAINRHGSAVTPQISCAETTSAPKSCGSQALPKGPEAIWFEWYAKTPRMWDVCSDQQKKSVYKHTDNYMKLFLPNGFELDPSEPDYGDLVLCTGIEAEAQLYKFVGENGIKSKNGPSILKHLRKFYRDSKLDTLIDVYRACSVATHSVNLHISATRTNGYILVGHMQCDHHS